MTFERKIVKIAETTKDEQKALRAMKILRKRYNRTYHWCVNWDYKVICNEGKEWRLCNCHKQQKKTHE